MQPQENKSSIGSIIGTIIIIAVIILGGLYFWSKRAEENKTKEALVSDTTQPTSEQSEANVIKSTSTTDDLGSIEADLKTTNTTNLGPEANTSTK